jgi:hypothetical protein
MRLLTQPKVLARALLAALITTLACYPRLVLWQERLYPLPFLGFTMFWCTCVFWAFVFAWHAEYARRPVFNFEFRPRLWAAATFCAAASALSLHYFMDPQLRLITPRDYPVDWPSWAALSLFRLGLEPLFLCFAPFAFFIRLSNRQTTALALTVLFWVFILYLRLNVSEKLPSFPVVVGLMVSSVVGGFLSVYFYLKGGAFLVWWLVFISQLRHLIDLGHGG